MTIKSRRSSSVEVLQPFPKKGLLGSRLHLNPSLRYLKQRLRTHRNEPIISYVVATIRIRNGSYWQKGNGPNWQGDYVTLCSCKHRMRTSLDPSHWKGVWIAGVTPFRRSQSPNCLLYLMKVGQAYESYYELWQQRIPLETLEAKRVDKNRFGDVFKHKRKLTTSESLIPDSYREPCSGHVHEAKQRWHKDIRYGGQRIAGHSPALLFGDQQHSYLWDHQKLRLKYPSRRCHPRREHKWKSLGNLLDHVHKIAQETG